VPEPRNQLLLNQVPGDNLRTPAPTRELGVDVFPQHAEPGLRAARGIAPADRCLLIFDEQQLPSGRAIKAATHKRIPHTSSVKGACDIPGHTGLSADPSLLLGTPQLL